MNPLFTLTATHNVLCIFFQIIYFFRHSISNFQAFFFLEYFFNSNGLFNRRYLEIRAFIHSFQTFAIILLILRLKITLVMYHLHIFIWINLIFTSEPSCGFKAIIISFLFLGGKDIHCVNFRTTWYSVFKSFKGSVKYFKFYYSSDNKE